MDTWWPKVTAEYGFFGLISYLGLILIPLARATFSFFKNRDFVSAFVFITGASLLAISVAAATFTHMIYVAIFATFLFTATISYGKAR